MNNFVDIPKEESDFKKMEKSDSQLTGNRGVIVCGFKPKEQLHFKKILKKVHISAPVVFPTDSMSSMTIDELNSTENGVGLGERSKLSRAVIAGGITTKEFQRLMNRVKESTLPRPMWATITEISQEWKLSKLLGELTLERAQMG